MKIKKSRNQSDKTNPLTPRPWSKVDRPRNHPGRPPRWSPGEKRAAVTHARQKRKRSFFFTYRRKKRQWSHTPGNQKRQTICSRFGEKPAVIIHGRKKKRRFLRKCRCSDDGSRRGLDNRSGQRERHGGRDEREVGQSVNAQG